MTKGQTTGLVISPETIEWTTLRGGKNRSTNVVDSGRTEQGVPADLTDADVAAEAADRLKVQCHGVKGDLAVGLPSEELLLRVLELPVHREGGGISGYG